MSARHFLPLPRHTAPGRARIRAGAKADAFSPPVTAYTDNKKIYINSETGDLL